MKIALTPHTYIEGRKFNFEEKFILDHKDNNYHTRRNRSEIIHITPNRRVNYRCQ